MAWSLVDSTQYQTGATKTTSFTVTLPTNAAGDVCIISAYKDGTNGNWSMAGGSSSWTLLSTNQSTTGAGRSTAIMYKVVGAGESNPTIVYSSNARQEISWTCHTFRSSVNTLSDANIIEDWAFAEGAGVQNPSNPDVTGTQADACVVLFQMQNLDDCTGAGAPSGYTLGETIIGSSMDNRQQLIAYDLAVASGVESPGAWTSTWNSSSSDYSVYSLMLHTDAPPTNPTITSISDMQLDVGETGIVLNGSDFGDPQGFGGVYIGDDPDYNTATLVSQTIDTWTDTQITFDVALGSFSDQHLWVFVEHDNLAVSNSQFINTGVADYIAKAAFTGTTLIYPFQNSTVDSIRNLGSLNQAGVTNFVTHPITRWDTHSLTFTDYSWCYRESETLSGYDTVSERAIGLWVDLDRVYQQNISIGCNGVFDMFGIKIGPGNALMGTSESNTSMMLTQSYGDFKLTTGRPYYLLIKVTAGTGLLRLFVDGVEMAKSVGTNVGTPQSWTFKTIRWGSVYAAVIGGHATDFVAPFDSNISQVHYWMDATPTDTEIREVLFELAAPPTDTLTSGTGAAMQTAMDAIAPKAYQDVPLPILVEKPTDGGGDMTLTLDSVTFDSRCSMHIQWEGDPGDTLTVVNDGTSNCDLSFCSTPNGGTILVPATAPITVNVKDIVDKTNIQGARVYIEAAAGGPLTVGDEIFNGLTDANGDILVSLSYTSDQPIVGKVRKASGAPYYKNTQLSATVLSDGADVSIFMERD